MKKQYLTWYETQNLMRYSYLVEVTKTILIEDLNKKQRRVLRDHNNLIPKGNYYLAYDGVGFYIYERGK